MKDRTELIARLYVYADKEEELAGIHHWKLKTGFCGRLGNRTAGIVGLGLAARLAGHHANLCLDLRIAAKELERPLKGKNASLYRRSIFR
jgi:hypothetical protein